MNKVVSVHYLFSRNEKIGSKIISSGTKFLNPKIENSPSHAAVLVDNRWVIESTLESGFRVIPYKKWLAINEELYKVLCVKVWTFESIKNLYKPLKNHKYDYFGVIYFTWRVLLQKMFNIKKPKKNLFNHKDKYFCCEVVGIMNGKSYEMTSPIELLSLIK